MRLVELEPGFRTMPTAVFYPGEGEARGAPTPPPCEFGRAAIAAYVDGIDGRLMRSMKSILGSSLIEQTTDVGGGRGVRYLDIVATYLRHLKPQRRGRGRRADRPRGARPAGLLRRRRPRARRPGRGGAAQRRRERRLSRGRVPVRADRRRVRPRAGGRRARRRCSSPTSAAAPPTSRSSASAPSASAQVDRKADILANHGVHIAGTDFDRRIELASDPAAVRLRRVRAEHRRRAGARGAERGLLRPRDLAPDQHRLQPAARRRAARHALVLRRPGAAPAADDGRRPSASATTCVARAESAKIAVADGGATTIELDHVEAGLASELDEAEARARARRRPRPHRRRGARRRSRRPASAPDADRRALPHRRLDRPRHAERAAARGPSRRARLVRGDRFASVATGLALFAQRRFAGRRRGADAPRRSAGEHRRHRHARSPRRCRVFSPATHIRPERTR